MVKTMMKTKRFKKVVEWNWKSQIESLLEGIILWSVIHYTTLWFDSFLFKLFTLGVLLLFLSLIPIFARLTANVYYEEIKFRLKFKAILLWSATMKEKMVFRFCLGD